MTIGERIKKRRIELGITQKELADKMGLKTKSSICHAEKNSNFEHDTIKKYAKALKCTTAYLMGLEDINGNPLVRPIEHDPREGILLACFHRMSEEDKEKFINMAYLFSGLGNIEKPKD